MCPTSIFVQLLKSFNQTSSLHAFTRYPSALHVWCLAYASKALYPLNPKHSHLAQIFHNFEWETISHEPPIYRFWKLSHQERHILQSFQIFQKKFQSFQIFLRFSAIIVNLLRFSIIIPKSSKIFCNHCKSSKIL